MSALNKKIKDIRIKMEGMRVEKYAIINPELVELDEYIKTLYLKALCTVIQYENTPSEMQALYLKRIVSGLKVENPMEEYMRRALEISEGDIEEFLKIMKESKVRYYFAVDSLLLISMGSMGDNNYEYLAELLDLIDVSKCDLEYISLVVKSILEQDSSYYDEAKSKLNNNVRGINLLPYIKDYYVGAVVDTDTEKCYLALNGMGDSHIDFPRLYTERKVSFNNLDIRVDKEWKFKGCKEVVFNKCNLYGENKLYFKAVGKVSFENCTFRKFSNRVAHLCDVEEFVSNNCEYIDCGFDFEYRGSLSGGVIYVNREGWGGKVILTNNSVLNCYVNNIYYNSDVSGAFIGFSGTLSEVRIENNEFNGCECWYNNKIHEVNWGGVIGSFDADSEIENNNVCTGKLSLLR